MRRLIVLYEGLKEVAEGYSEWDRAEYRRACQLLSAAIKTLDNRLVNEKKPTTPLIADMFSYARRRIRDEERYDDGVARVYRTIEMAVQLLLVKVIVDCLT